MTENIIKCSNFKNCGNSWTEDYDNAYQFCSKECKKYYELIKFGEKNRKSLIDKLLDNAYIENKWSEKKEND